jgi:hypothetical protein
MFEACNCKQIFVHQVYIYIYIYILIIYQHTKLHLRMSVMVNIFPLCAIRFLILQTQKQIHDSDFRR